jgi:hypothetical protein
MAQSVYAFRLDRRRENECVIADTLDRWIGEVKAENPDHGLRQIMIPLIERYLNEDKPYAPAEERAIRDGFAALQQQLDMVTALVRAIKANPGAVMQAIEDADDDEIDSVFVANITRGMSR